MLTYRTGAAGSPSAAKAMGEHLLQQTLSPEMAAMAEYYQQGVAPPTAAEAARARYGGLAGEGGTLDPAALDAALSDEINRLRENAAGPGASPPEDLARDAAGAIAGAGLAS
ncbi:hypothetical protein HUK83_01315, partial [Endobacter medicaginis]